MAAGFMVAVSMEGFTVASIVASASAVAGGAPAGAGVGQPLGGVGDPVGAGVLVGVGAAAGPGFPAGAGCGVRSNRFPAPAVRRFTLANGVQNSME